LSAALPLLREVIEQRAELIQAAKHRAGGNC
jgi:hypothetical protein